MKEMKYKPNMNKAFTINIEDEEFMRIPIKTHLIKKNDNIIDIVIKYLKDNVKEDDIVFITEKIVSITQGRAYPVNKIKAGKLAKFLARFVKKTPAGIGLGMPETMEMALRECGVPRILLASIIGGFSKIILRRKGDFYRIAGSKARAIDGPTQNTIPPYNTYVVLGPLNTDKISKEISNILNGAKVAIVDINDHGGNILGKSHKEIDSKLLVNILKDNPLGQCHEKTPIGIIRKVEKGK